MGAAALIVVLLQLAGLFALLSLLAVGGGNGVIPAMQRAAVDVHHWMSARQFLDLFAIARAAPGPGSLIVALIGQRAAGLPGAVVASLAMYTPSSLIVFCAARVWHTYQAAAWRQQVERALAPVAVGLTYASGLVLLQGTAHGAGAYILTGASAVVLAVTELHPVLLLAACGAVAVLGWV